MDFPSISGNELTIAGIFLANAVLVVLAAFAIKYRIAYGDAADELQRYSELVNNLHEGIYRTTPDGRQLSSNPAFFRLNGYANEAEHVAAVKDIANEWYVDPNRRQEFQEALQRDGKVEDFVSEIYRYKTRERIWVSESARLVRNRRTGTPEFYEGSVHEITETVNRLKLEEQFRKLTNQVPGGLFQFCRHPDGSFTIPYLNLGWEIITGIRPEDEMSNVGQFRKGIDVADLAEHDHRLKESAERLVRWAHEFRYRTPDGQEKWLEVSAQPEAVDGTITWHGYLADISVRKKHEVEIAELAYFDPLTRLPNRRFFLDQMSASIRLRKMQGDVGALLFIDLDNFKSLNDTQGHDVGDAFLIEVAKKLRQAASANDTVARIGGDEFVIILDGAGANVTRGTANAMSVASRLLDLMRPGFSLGSLSHISSASIGIAVFDGSEARPDEILKRADVAMYQAKMSGRNSIALFDPAEIDRQSARYRLASDLAHALTSDELELYFQPQIDAGGSVFGAEALLRWNHPEFDLVMPDQFVSLADQFGLAADMDRLVLSKGMQTLKDWSALRRTSRLRLALNVGVQAFANDAFVPMVRDMITAYGVDASLMTFEVTEHVMAKDQARVAERMRALKQLGIRLSLDDFGTGYSSLAYLKQLPFDEIKIDGSFVTDIETDVSDRGLVRAILAMSQSLGLTSVAEHVENANQEAFLRSLGCNIFQGYLYSRALPIGQFNELLAAGRRASTAKRGAKAATRIPA